MSNHFPSFEARLASEYREALLEFARGSGEAALIRAYEVGRRANGAQLSILDVVRLHEQATLELVQAGEAAASPHLVQFLAEALSPFEMTLRAHRENVRLLGLSNLPARQDDDVVRAREQLRTILDATTAVIYLRDVSGDFLFVNSQFERIFHVRRSDFAGPIPRTVLPPQVGRVLGAGDAAAIEKGEPLESEETLHLEDGEHTYLSLKFPLMDPDGGGSYAICCVATDISERQRTAEAIRAARDVANQAIRELRDTQAQLIHSAKMASLGELVAGIAHELNNPLAFAISHLHTVKRCLAAHALAASVGASSEWDRAMNRLDEMDGGLARIRELVQKLRVFSRLDEGERKKVSVRESVESVLMILGHLIKDRITIETALLAPDIVDCYPSLLNQAILNIVANAIDASPDGGTIKIATEAVEDEYRISVADAGPGIPIDLRERVLEPFFTTKPVGHGTGLGLSITYSIVRKHEGTLDFEFPEGGGTIAIIRLPRAGVR